jgi:hypothetical protein
LGDDGGCAEGGGWLLTDAVGGFASEGGILETCPTHDTDNALISVNFPLSDQLF